MIGSLKAKASKGSLHTQIVFFFLASYRVTANSNSSSTEALLRLKHDLMFYLTSAILNIAALGPWVPAEQEVGVMGSIVGTLVAASFS